MRAGGADVDSLVRERESGVHEIIFHPTRAAPHRVHIKYNEVHIPGITSLYFRIILTLKFINMKTLIINYQKLCIFTYNHIYII